ncbi:MAG: anti-sigma factor family protein [Gemmatimonadota bacterium]
MNPCRAFLDDFSAFVDGHLSSARRDEIQAHVDCCQGCLDHLTAYRRGITVLRSLEAEAPADFWERVERRLWRGDALTVLEGGRASGPASHAGGWPSPTVAVAAAAVLALFVIVRGLGPEATSGTVGPQRVQASVVMTLPEVPESGASAPAGVSAADAPADQERTVARANDSADPAEAVLARVDSRLTSPLKIESALVSDGWVQPVQLGNDWSRTRILPATLVRPASAVTPAPWNVDQAVGLP